MASKLRREELVVLVEKLLKAEGTEEEQDEWLRLLQENVLHPRVSDLIYYPDVELSAEDIVEVALSYKPITLPAKIEGDSRE